MSDSLEPPRPHRFSQIPLSPPVVPPFTQYLESPRVPNQDSHEKTRTPTPFSSPPSTGIQPLLPYIGLTSRLSLTLLTLPLLSLLLSISHLLSSSTAARDHAEDARAQIMATCRGVEQGAAWVHNLPRIMAEKMNDEIVRGVRATLIGLAVVLEHSLTIIEAVIGFIIDTYRSLLMCTIEFMVRGTLALLIGAVEAISSGVTTSLNAVRTSIQSDISSANSVIQSAVSAINSVTTLVNVNLSVPQFTVPSLKALEDVKVPSTLEDRLIKLNSSIPSLNELRDIIQEVLEVPFDNLRKDLNETFTGLAQRFNTSVLPVPGGTAMQTLVARGPTSNSTLDLCSGMDTSFIDDVADSLNHMAKVGIGLLILAFFLLWLALVAWEWYRWRAMNGQAELVEEQIRADHTAGRQSGGMRLVQVVEHPLLERYAGPVLERITRTPQQETNLRWLLSFVTHGPALAVLFFGTLTFLVVQVQIGAVHGLRARSLESSNASISASSRSIAQTLNEAYLKQSLEYAVKMNDIIEGWQEDIDSTVFGPWLNTTTVVLNGTLVKFYDEVEKILHATFGKTVLAQPVQTFAYCILGSKIDNLEKGLTWIHDNAKVNLPIISPNALMLSNATMEQVATPIASAAAGSGEGGDGGVVGSIFDRYLKQLERERTIALLFIALWGLLVLIGVLIVVWHSGVGDRFMRWRFGRQGSSKPPYAPATWRGKPISHYPAGSFDEKQTSSVPHINEPERGSAPSVGPWAFAEHATRSQESFSESAPPRATHLSSFAPSKRMLDLKTTAQSLFGCSAGLQDNAVGAIPYQSDRGGPAAWPGKVRGVVTSLLKVPGPQLARNTSQRSDRSWVAQEASPWSDQSGRYRGDNLSEGKLDRRTSNWSAVYPAPEGSRYPHIQPRVIPPPIQVPVRQDNTHHERDPASPDSAAYSDAEETTPLTGSYQGRAPVSKEYFDTHRHPRKTNPFATPFDD